MKTLDEAWAWYQAASAASKWLGRLAAHWNELPWGSNTDWLRGFERDRELGQLEAERLERAEATIRTPLDDLAVRVLFSVFEATVREIVERQLAPEIETLEHPALREAGADLRRAVEEGSFYRVLELAKAQVDANAVEHVNQVRKYRNWVAHGRRLRSPNEKYEEIGPTAAYERLTRFLNLLLPPYRLPDESADG